MKRVAPGVLRVLSSLRHPGGALREASILFGGSATGQIVALLLSPILTRVYLPSELGLFGLISATVAIGSVAVTLGYDQAIIGARSQRQALLVGAASLLSTLVLSILLAFACYLGWNIIDSPTCPPAIVFVVVVGIVILSNMYSVALYWYIRQRRTRAVFVGTLSNYATRSILQAGAGAAGFGFSGLLAGELGGRALSLLLLDWRGVAGRTAQMAFFYPRQVWLVAAKHLQFPLHQMPASVLEAAFVWLPVPVVAATYGPVQAGLLVLVQRLGTAPATLLNSSIVQIFYQRASSHVHSAPQFLRRRSMHLLLAVIVGYIPVQLGLLVWGGQLFGLVFGPQWMMAGLLAAIWAPLVLFQVLAQFASRLLLLLGTSRLRLASMILQVLIVPAIVASGRVIGLPFELSLLLAVTASCLVHAALIAITLALLQKRTPSE